MKMFKIYSFIVALFLMMTACGNDSEHVGPRVSVDGEWQLVSVNGVEPEFTVYVGFMGGLFNIYQQLYTWDYAYYDGQYAVRGYVVSGDYFDGTKWKCSYVASLSEDGQTLTLVSKERNPITCVYEQCVIPEEIIEEATTRAAANFDYHF